jgi:hypothetical protein
VAQVRVQQKLSNMLSPQLCHRDDAKASTGKKAGFVKATAIIAPVIRPRSAAARLKRAPRRTSCGSS